VPAEVHGQFVLHGGRSSEIDRSPPPGPSTTPNHRLPAGMHMDVLDRDFLLAHSILKAMPVDVVITDLRMSAVAHRSAAACACLRNRPWYS
jgi:hypothetical protein